MEVRGYKVFNPDWTCRDKQYTCPGSFKEDAVEVCKKGMHFCKKLTDCFSYYDFIPENHVAEVIAHGNVESYETICCTDELEIMRELSWNEVLDIVNTGRFNTERFNTGDCNTGDFNAGRFNTGSNNTGDFNTGSNNTGCFMTIEPNLMMFNKPTEWKLMDWINSHAYFILARMPYTTTIFIKSETMTCKEKEDHPDYKNVGGYLKVIEATPEDRQEWWDNLPFADQEEIKSLPNFDASIFEECTGIKVE